MWQAECVPFREAMGAMTNRGCAVQTCPLAGVRAPRSSSSTDVQERVQCSAFALLPQPYTSPVQRCACQTFRSLLECRIGIQHRRHASGSKSTCQAHEFSEYMICVVCSALSCPTIATQINCTWATSSHELQTSAAHRCVCRAVQDEDDDAGRPHRTARDVQRRTVRRGNEEGAGAPAGAVL